MSESRRDFLLTLPAAPAVIAQRNAEKPLGLAVIGVGTRGHYLLNEFQQVPGIEIRYIADLYKGNIERALKIAKNPEVRVTREWERAVDDPGVDAVVIATPDFWHAPMTIRAAKAGKHVYVEKAWCRTLEEAKAMRKAVTENKIVMQLGHNYRSEPSLHRAREIYRSGALGKVTAVRMYMDRTSAYQEFKYYTDYMIKQPPKDAGPDTIDWDRYVAAAPKRPFSVDRFFTWRCYWDYGTGTAGDLMSHLWDSVNFIAGIGIPASCICHGAMYYWKEEREVPDQWNVVFDYPRHEMSVLFGSVFHNRHVSELVQFLGREKTMEYSMRTVRTYPKEWGDEYRDKFAKLRKDTEAAGRDPFQAAWPPDYWWKPGELEVSSHWQDFVDCIRTRQKPRCHVDAAFEEAVTVVMSIEAYRRRREVRWDPVKEEIV